MSQGPAQNSKVRWKQATNDSEALSSTPHHQTFAVYSAGVNEPEGTNRRRVRLQFVRRRSLSVANLGSIPSTALRVIETLNTSLRRTDGVSDSSANRHTLVIPLTTPRYSASYLTPNRHGESSILYRTAAIRS
jgi:hypothetical protein